MDVLGSTPNSVRGNECGRLSKEHPKDEINTSFTNLLEVSTAFSHEVCCLFSQSITIFLKVLLWVFSVIGHYLN